MSATLEGAPAAAFSEARSLPFSSAPSTRSGGCTRHGAALTRLGLHPRLARMVMKASELGARGTACELAALLAERDLLRRNEGVAEADIRTRPDVLRGTTVRQDETGRRWVPSSTRGSRSTCFRRPEDRFK